jgi:hypothetical protein
MPAALRLSLKKGTVESAIKKTGKQRIAKRIAFFIFPPDSFLIL